MIFAFGHTKAVGKDEFIKFIISNLRQNRSFNRNRQVVRISFAEKVKEIAYFLFKHHGIKRSVEYNNDPSLKETYIPSLNKTVRELWIEIGNRLRDVHTNVWIENALIGYKDDDIVLINDLRFPTELEHIKATGGKVFNVVRPGSVIKYDGADNVLLHYSAWDGVIINDQDLTHLEVLANEWVKKWVL